MSRSCCFERELGRWDTVAADRLLKSNASWSEVEQEVERMAGPRGLMIFTRINQGEIISLSGEVKRCSLYLVGNPVIANKIISIDIRGSFYVPFRACLYDYATAGSAVISYDLPFSFLAGLERPGLEEIGLILDQKIDGAFAQNMSIEQMVQAEATVFDSKPTSDDERH